MDRGPATRPLLPQTTQMQTFQFAPPNLGLGDTKKNYVFVDEHNRHKRLKVMRACEGCRRRKIKCDAATTNSWPCAACVRLKLHCVPPTVNYNRTHVAGGHISGLERVLDFDNSSGSDDNDYNQSTNLPHTYELGSGPENLSTSQTQYSDGIAAFHAPPYTEKNDSQHSLPYDQVSSIQVPNLQAYHSHSNYHVPSNHTASIADSGDSWTHEQVSAANLSNALGELKIDESGIAPYIFQQKKTLAEAPALEEFEAKLPLANAGSAYSGSTVRIPPELMPSEEQVMDLFDIFFTNIHPYVPVISKPYFYQQWHTNRKSISPLLLEAIFACAGRMSEDPAQGAQWLALASKHENCFMDVPRLSTIQALLVLLKARESAPKRGYYYRSWMTIKTLVAMAKDLELHEHFADHQEGRDCGGDPTECLVKTRIWQNIFVCEIMIGGPQGRSDFSVDNDSLDINVPHPSPNVDDSEYQVSRKFTYLVRVARNVRVMTEIYGKVKKQKDWGLDQRFVDLNPTVAKWTDDLPSDLQVHYPPDGSPPWLQSHLVGNMHSYHHLSIIMLHRPQLMAPASFSVGGDWKDHMSLCYSSAKKLCRLQEAVYQTFGLPGLLCMQRGINFTIYTVLTCTMLHLVAITSPDPEFNTDAKEYFTRHMRILESCTSSWPMPEMEAQIQALREAFSADTSRPFQLKPSFPYGSPAARLQPSPPADVHYQDPLLSRQTSHEQTPGLHYNTRPMTPPISASEHESKDGSIAAASLTMMASGQRQHQQMPDSSLGHDNVPWNPTRIFEYGATSHKFKSHVSRLPANPRKSQWNTAFGTPSSTISAGAITAAQVSPSVYTPSSISSHDLPHINDAMQQQQQYSLSSNMPQLPQIHQPQPSIYSSGHAGFVTPSMWQDTVASTYDPAGLKRRWDMGPSYYNDQQQVKRPR